MKSHLTKISLAVLSTVFLLGCQEQGSGAVGPEGPQFHGGAGDCNGHHKNDMGCDGGGGDVHVEANLTMTGGMTASSQPVRFKDGENNIEFIGAITLKMNLTNTLRVDCTESSRRKAVDPDFDTLFDKLVDGPRLRSSIFVDVDMNDLGGVSEGSTIHVVWDDNDGSFNLNVGRLTTAGTGESTVTAIGGLSEPNGLTVTFTGGEIRLRNLTGKNPEHFNLTCPVHVDDVITMVMTAVES